MGKVVCAIVVALLSSHLCAAPKKSVARKASGRKSARTAARQKAPPPQDQARAPAPPAHSLEVSQGVQDAIGSARADFTCAEHFDLCMDNICAGDMGSTYQCSSTNDDFEFVERGGMNVRVGLELYNFARTTCLGALKTCSLAERGHVENAYKSKVQKDMLTKNYVEAMRYSGEEAAEEAKAAYKECMGGICGPGFFDCFTLAGIERRAPSCEPALQSTARAASVKKSFYEEMEKLFAKMCSGGGGEVRYDNKKCEITVKFGVPQVIFVPPPNNECEVALGEGAAPGPLDMVKSLMGKNKEVDPADRKCPNVRTYSGKMEKYLGEK
ncbi:MAG: hypothetical protein LBH41_00485, partial [Rickettsiales bacterium]|nr:hypothetical protein [Rickettsiales bacterium]